MPPKWFAACFGRTNAEDGHVASASAAARRAGYEDDGISPAKSDSKRSSNMFGSGKGNAKGGDVAAWGQDVDGGGAEGPGNSARKLRIISTTNGPSGPLPDSPSAKLRTSKKHLRAHLKQAQPKRSILKRGGTDSMAGGGDVDIDALDDGEAPWDVDDCPSAPCSPAGGAGGAGFGDGPAYGRNSSNAWEPSPSRFSGSASRIVPLPANNAPAAAATTGGMAAAGRPGSDRRASGGSWVGGGERPVSPAAGQVYGNPCSGGPVQQFTAPYGNGCDGGACMVNGGGPDEAGAEPAPWLRRGGGGDIHAEAAGGGGGAAFGRQISSPVPDAAASAGGAGWGVSLPTPSRLAHSSTAGVAGLDGPGQGGPSGYDSHGGGGGGSRLSSARGGLRGGGVPAVVVHSGGGGTSGGGVSVASSALRAALAQGGAGGSRSSQAAHMHDGQSAKPLAVSALRASTTAGGSGGVMSAPVVWSINELCEPAEGEQPEGLYPPASYGGGSAAAGVDGGPYGSSRRASFQAPAPQTQRSLRAERPAALILPIERPGSGRSPAGGAPNSGGGGGGGGGGHHSLRISPAAAAAAGLASCGQDTPMSMPAGAAAAAFSRRITNTSNPMSALVSPTTAAGPSSCAALAGATRDEVMRMLAAESPGRSSMWYDHKARELMQAAEAARGSDGAGRAGMQQQLQPQRQYARPSVPGDGRSSHVLTHSVSAFTQLAATTCCQDPAAAAAAVGADAVPLSAPASALDGYAAASSSVGGAAGSSHVFSLSSRSALQGGPGGGRGGGGGGGLGGTSYSLLGDATGEARRPSAAGPDGGNNSIGRVRGGNYADSAPATHTGLVLPGSLGGLPGSITGGDEDGLFPNGLANHAPDVVGAAAAAILLAPPEQLQQQQAAAAAAFAPGSYHPSRNQSFLQRYASGSGLSERRERVVGGADNGHAAFRARAATISTSGGGRPAALPGSDGLLNTPNAANRPGGTWRAAVTSSTAAAAAASHSPHAHARAVAGAAPKAWDIDAPAVAEARALAAPAVPAAGATRAPAKADPALEPPELVLSAAAAKLASLMSLARLHSDSEEEQEEAEAEGS